MSTFESFPYREIPGDGSCFASSSWAPRRVVAFRNGIADVRCAGQHETGIRASKHSGLDRGQRRRRALVSDQCLARSAPATDRDTAAASKGRQAASQSDRRRDPDQRRGRCGRRPVVDARGLAVCDLCPPEECLRSSRPTASSTCSARRTCARQPIEVDTGIRAGTARRLAVRHRDYAVRGARQGRMVSGGQEFTPPASDGAGDTLGLRIADKATGKHFYFLAACAAVTEELKSRLARRAAGVLRWHGVARRRIDRGRAWQQDRPRHGPYRDVGRTRARSKALPASISAGRCSCISTIPTRRCCTIPPSARWPSARAGKFPPTERRSRFERDDVDRDDRLFARHAARRCNSAEELEATLRQIGAMRYHNLHPFHRLLHGGKLNKGQVQAWALNRYFYQSTIPIKDAVVISRFPRPRHPAGMAAPDRGP